MRYVFAVITLVMLAFVAVQYNDADGPLWALFYGVSAIWAGIAAVRPPLLAGRVGRALLGICVLAAVGLTIWLWPPVAGWWQEQVWGMGMIDPRAAEIAELARESMGLMIATAVLLAVLARSLSMDASPAVQGRSSMPQSS